MSARLTSEHKWALQMQLVVTFRETKKPRHDNTRWRVEAAAFRGASGMGEAANKQLSFHHRGVERVGHLNQTTMNAGRL